VLWGSVVIEQELIKKETGQHFKLNAFDIGLTFLGYCSRGESPPPVVAVAVDGAVIAVTAAVASA
jgi:hypothetical protein